MSKTDLRKADFLRYSPMNGQKLDTKAVHKKLNIVKAGISLYCAPTREYRRGFGRNREYVFEWDDYGRVGRRVVIRYGMLLEPKKDVPFITLTWKKGSDLEVNHIKKEMCLSERLKRDYLLPILV